MTVYLKVSTASQEVPIGMFLDPSDGNTEETGLTIAASDIKLWKAGGTSMVAKNSGGATHMANGIYSIVLDATDTNTLGSLVIYVHVAGALSVRQECIVLTANVYDTWFSTDVLDVNVAQWLGTAVHTPTTNGVPMTDVHAIADGAITSSAFTAAAVDAGAVATDIVNEISAAVWDVVITSGHSTVGSAAVVVKDTLEDTAVIGVLGVGLTAIPWNAAWDAEVQSEVTDALNAYDPPTKTEMDDLPTAAEIKTAIEAAGGHLALILEDTGTTLDTLVKDIPTTAEFEARTIAAADYVVVGDTIARVTLVDKVTLGDRVTLVDTCTANTDMRGTDSAALASVCTEARLAELAAANLPADVDAILLDTGTTLDALLKRTLGLVQENFAISSPIYSVTGKMTSCTMKTYPSAADVATDTNAVATYTVTATYDVNDNLATYKVVKA